MGIKEARTLVIKSNYNEDADLQQHSIHIVEHTLDIPVMKPLKRTSSIDIRGKEAEAQRSTSRMLLLQDTWHISSCT